MALPLSLAVSMIGGFLGYWVQKYSFEHSLKSFSVLLLLLPTGLYLETKQKVEPIMVPLVTSVEVERSPKEVWPHLITFSEIESPKELLFSSNWVGDSSTKK